jgi:hypothetical protein
MIQINAIAYTGSMAMNALPVDSYASEWRRDSLFLADDGRPHWEGPMERQDSNPMPGRVVRVVLPAKVAFNLKEMQDVLGHLAERLGCTPCLSGASCVFHIESDFVVDPARGGLIGVHETGR